MLALLHAVWKSLIHCVMALTWAVEPEALIVPFAHWIDPDALDEPPPAPAPVVVELLELLSEPQAAMARAPAMATPLRRRVRESFTEVVSFSFVGHLVRARGQGRAGTAHAWR